MFDATGFQPFDKTVYVVVEFTPNGTDNKKLNLIKEIRAATSWGLKDSKDFMEAFMPSPGPPYDVAHITIIKMKSQDFKSLRAKFDEMQRDFYIGPVPHIYELVREPTF